MKKFLSLLLVAYLFQGCTPKYVQLYKTDSTNTKNIDSFYVYENDTIRIDYRFWGDGGMILFRISNKSDKPIYIDWKKSTLISTNGRYDYWSDKSATNISFKSYTEHDDALFPTIYGFTSTGNINIKTTKQERIVFIPPKSYITTGRYPIVKDYIPPNIKGDDFEKQVGPRNDNPKKETIVYVKKFQRENSNMRFRNFLTFSFKEDFSTEFYADNEFFVKEIDVMDTRHFSHYILGKSNDVIEVNTFRKATDFYTLLNSFY